MAVIDPNVELVGVQGQVNSFLVQKYRSSLAAFIKLPENKNRRDVKELFETKVFNPWLQANGFYDTKGPGILVSGHDGKYPNYPGFVKTKAKLTEENQEQLTETGIQNHDADLARNIETAQNMPGKGTTLDKLLDLPEGVLSVRDLTGVVNAGQYSQEILLC